LTTAKPALFLILLLHNTVPFIMAALLSAASLELPASVPVMEIKPGVHANSIRKI
jgi:hypothetical protein